MIEKIDVKQLVEDFKGNSKPTQRKLARQALSRAYRANINQPESELIFARQLREAIQDGQFSMGSLEEDLLNKWIGTRRPLWGTDGYSSEIEVRWALELALGELYHFDLAKRFVSFAKKAIGESKKLEAETTRRKKAVA